MTTPRDQANAFILALETELPGLGARASRQMLTELALAWADGHEHGAILSHEPLRGPVERLARALGITGPRNAVERALAAVEASDAQPGAVQP